MKKQTFFQAMEESLGSMGPGFKRQKAYSLKIKNTIFREHKLLNF